MIRQKQPFSTIELRRLLHLRISGIDKGALFFKGGDFVLTDVEAALYPVEVMQSHPCKSSNSREG